MPTVPRIEGPQVQERGLGNVRLNVNAPIEAFGGGASYERAVRARREEARLDEATRLENRKARQEETVTQLQQLTSAGVTFDGLREGDPDSFQHLVDVQLSD